MGRAVTVSVGPLATASATKVAASQKAAIAGTNYLVLNGAAGVATANSVCASQTPAGAGALTLNGTLASSVPTGTAIAYLPQASRIYITGGSDESGKTFAVVGYRFSASGGPFAVTETITGPNASTVSSQNQYDQIISITASAGTTGAITVGHYGTATLDLARSVRITSAGNDSSITFTIAGTDWAGSAISEVVTGSNGSTADSVLSFKTVTSIATSAAVATTVTIGTNTLARSPWVRLDPAYASMAQVGIQCVVTGTVSYDVESTYDDPNSTTNPVGPSSVTWFNSPDTNVVAATTSQQSRYDVAPAFVSVYLNSGSGTVTATFTQIGTW